MGVLTEGCHQRKAQHNHPVPNWRREQCAATHAHLCPHTLRLLGLLLQLVHHCSAHRPRGNIKGKLNTIAICSPDMHVIEIVKLKVNLTFEEVVGILSKAHLL